MEELSKPDWISGVRYASVYRRFDGVNAFREQFSRLEKQQCSRGARCQPLDLLADGQ